MSEQTPGDPSAVPESSTAQEIVGRCSHCDHRATIHQREQKCAFCGEWEWIIASVQPAALASSASVPPTDIPHYTVSRHLLDTLGEYYNADRVKRIKESAATLQRAFDEFVRQTRGNGSDLVLVWEKDFLLMTAAALPPSSEGQPPRGETDAPLTDVAARLGIPAHTFAVLRSVLDGTFTPEAGDAFDYAGEVRARLGVAALPSGLIPALRELSEQLKQEDFHDTCSARLDRILARFP